MPEFEFDPAKSAANLVKHGIDFTAAQALWRDPHRIEVPARTVDEPRWVVIGQIGDRCWSAVVTYRDEGSDHLRTPLTGRGEGNL